MHLALSSLHFIVIDAYYLGFLLTSIDVLHLFW